MEPVFIRQNIFGPCFFSKTFSTKDYFEKKYLDITFMDQNFWLTKNFIYFSTKGFFYNALVSTKLFWDIKSWLFGWILLGLILIT